MEAVKTPEGVIQYANLVEPFAFKGSNPKYNVTICFPDSADLSELEAAIAQAGGRFGNNPGINLCLKTNGEERGFLHKRYITPSNKTRPPVAVFDKDLTQESRPVVEKQYERFVQGAKVRAKVTVASYASGNNRGVTAYLNGIFLTQDADPSDPIAMSLADWND